MMHHPELQIPPNNVSAHPLCTVESAALTAALLTTSPPAVSLEDAAAVARSGYGAADCQPLTGERDRNFRMRRGDGSSLTLKFINAAETVAETEMQIAVLRHLAGRCAVPVPAHHAPQGVGAADWLSHQPPGPGEPAVRVRAYSFLEGEPGSALRAEPAAWTALGRAAGELDAALADFSHPAAGRRFLWNVCEAPSMRPLLEAVEDAKHRRLLAGFLDLYASHTAPALQGLPQQIIHNDLSASNLLTDASGQAVAGVLDFGDMVQAPRIAEIAIAASYQMTQTDAPMRVLDCMLDGYASVLALSPQERALTLDLVLARLAQRMVITAWRARQFPGNRDYILRSHAAATRLFDALIGPWKNGRDPRAAASASH
ncbi:phosphotransferase [Achromobacter sp. SD115]|uniref:phosphotransferase n=1 Tax=Achromobacter sp. SD115 TaxID=2782011 RepID=UPI001A977D20|nr:phosphotransferase [Achromobacter sp. SD115]MBO1014996.1 phosphotransferase [Achromobacter sp. SD115]